MKGRARVVHVAGSRTRADEVGLFGRQLGAAGIDVTSCEHIDPSRSVRGRDAQHLIREEVADVEGADAVVLFADAAGSGWCEVVLPSAVALRKWILVVGGDRGQFDLLPGVEILQTRDQALALLAMGEAERILRDIIRARLEDLERAPGSSRKQAAERAWSSILGSLDALSRGNMLEPEVSATIMHEVTTELSRFGMRFMRGSSERSISIGLESDTDV